MGYKLIINIRLIRNKKKIFRLDTKNNIFFIPVAEKYFYVTRILNKIDEEDTDKTRRIVREI